MQPMPEVIPPQINIPMEGSIMQPMPEVIPSSDNSIPSEVSIMLPMTGHIQTTIVSIYDIQMLIRYMANYKNSKQDWKSMIPQWISF